MISDYIAAHRKAILAAIGAVLIWFVDDATVDAVVATVDTLLVLLVSNDPAAVARVYRR